MCKNLFLAALAALSINSAQAVIVVNGVAGEDLDNASPFETLQKAVNIANNGAETIIEIQTQGPIPGASIGEGRNLKHPLTIQAAPGLFPTLVTGLDFGPTTGTHLITLSGLNVSTTGLNTPLIAGTSIVADNCNFNANPAGGGAYGPAVSAAIPSPTTTATLTMTSCTLIGHVGLQAGRACSDYILTRCEVIGKTTDLPPVFSVGITTAMNWHGTFSYRMGTANGFDEIQKPRTVMLDRCIVRGGVPLGWPNSTLDAAYYQNENSTIGPVTAVNTVFDAQPINAAGEANRINHPSLPPNQNASSTFKHCTFRSTNAFGLFYFPGGQPTTYTFTDCLFDMMNGNYGIYDPNPTTPNVVLAGDANSYHVPAGTEVFGRPAFESTKHFYIGNTAVAPNLTDTIGGLLLPHEDVVAEAIATVPPTLVDKDGNSRPLPVSALASDIGADEINETAPSSVNSWSLY